MSSFIELALERLEAVGGRTELRDAPGVALSPCHAGQLGKQLVENGGSLASGRSTNVFFYLSEEIFTERQGR